jgi:quercetin dioxygenase-like cupin family protein
MAKKGQILTNPQSGDMYEFLETAKETNGQRVTIKVTLKTKGPLVPDHMHTIQDESFEVLSGKLTILSEGKTTILSSGEKIAFPKNNPHNHYNNDDKVDTVFIQTLSPALDFEYLLETIVGLSTDGKMPNGKAGLIQELVILKYIDSKSFLINIPLGVQKLLMNTVAPIGRLLGYRAVYKKYSGIEK